MAESVITIANMSGAANEAVNNMFSLIINDKLYLSRFRTSKKNDRYCDTIVNSEKNEKLIREGFIGEVVDDGYTASKTVIYKKH